MKIYTLPPVRLVTIAALLLLALVSCSRDMVSSSNQNVPFYSFSRQLAKEYQHQAKAISGLREWQKRNYYLQKASAASQGNDVAPEMISGEGIPDVMVPILTEAREQLGLLITPDVKRHFPKEAAQVQMLFDCWVIEQKYKATPDQIAQCSERFYKALDGLYTMAAQDDINTDIRAAFQPSLSFYFEEQQADVKPKDKQVIKHLADQLKQVRSYDITLNGYIWPNASKGRLEMVQMQRLSRVKEAFVQAGVREDYISLFMINQPSKQPVKSAQSVDSYVEVVLDYLD